ncbi:DUF2877 domain-containing protein [Actinomycetospora lutea]|uniref:oxamate carbamoyltransferase subunit AllH family protein n=1 Tax=Actinomycetospora lutea TaxID=663604 RepID=UPI002367083B|nr:DUF2877 domain-containing protein [Actinomycetospora lutea]MDD7938290.1 DUF2877 domain-containing protein [Actinomycetospora lutea]
MIVDAGLGAAGLLRRPVAGRVVSVHRKAAYLRLDTEQSGEHADRGAGHIDGAGALVALVAPGVEPGPVHVRCTTLPPCRIGEAVTGDGSRLAGPRWALRGPGAVWWGTTPGPDALAARDDDLVRAALVPGELLAAAARATSPEDLAAAVGGRGPGLTPAGDDVLAGVVLVERAAGGPGVEDRLAAVCAAVRTTGPSRAFLAWAARGQSVAPAHDWLHAVAAGDRAAATRALARLHALGADSGRHLAAGMALRLLTLPGQLPRVVSQTARAAPGPGLRHRV